jgi:hypothetical protein
MRRLVIVTCTPDIAIMLRAGKAFGCVVVGERESFERNEVEVKLESESFAPVPEATEIPRAMLKGNPDGTFRVVPL